MSRFGNRFRNLFTRRQRYSELAESIREHLQEKTADLVADRMSPDEAHLAALREFGNVTRIEERSREAWQWPSIGGDLRTGAARGPCGSDHRPAQ